MSKTIMHTLATALRTTLCTLAVTGVAYPLLVTSIAQFFFANQANGSLVRDSRGEIVGSELLGQAFEGPSYFHPRPSAANYDAGASGGSNLGPTSKNLFTRTSADVERLRRKNRTPSAVPKDLATASGSGLDPHISPEAADWQAPRIADSRGVAIARVRSLIEAHTEGRDWGILGEPRVNVLLVNLALDRLFTRQTPQP